MILLIDSILLSMSVSMVLFSFFSASLPVSLLNLVQSVIIFLFGPSSAMFIFIEYLISSWSDFETPEITFQLVSSGAPVVARVRSMTDVSFFLLQVGVVPWFLIIRLWFRASPRKSFPL